MLDEHCLGIAVIAPSALMRGVATAVLLVFRPPCPLDLFHSQSDCG